MALRMNTPPRQRIRRFGSKVALSLATLLVVVVALGAVGGGAYMWYMGTHGGKEGTVYKQTDTPSSRQKAASLGTNLAVESITSPVMPGANATMIVKTDPGAKCVVEVTYDRTKAVDGGLIQKTADKEGNVSWTWKVVPTAPEGKWPAKVTCTDKKSSTIAQGELVVSKLQQPSPPTSKS